MRATHMRFFSVTGEPDELQSSSLTDAVLRLSRLLEISPTTEGKLSSYSLRVGKHTQHFLLGIQFKSHMKYEQSDAYFIF